MYIVILWYLCRYLLCKYNYHMVAFTWSICSPVLLDVMIVIECSCKRKKLWNFDSSDLYESAQHNFQSLILGCLRRESWFHVAAVPYMYNVKNNQTVSLMNVAYFLLLIVAYTFQMARLERFEILACCESLLLRHTMKSLTYFPDNVLSFERAQLYAMID